MSDKQNQIDRPERKEAEATAVRVECYAGYRADELPRRFFIGRRKVEVLEIIDRWLDPAHSHFKVRGNDGGIYILRYELGTDTWEMILYDSGTHAGTRLSST